MRAISILAVLLPVATVCTTAQPCNLLTKDGAKINLEITTWTNTLLYDQKFMKEKKEEKRQEQIDTYNSGVASGSIPPASKTKMLYTASKTNWPVGNEYKFTTNIAGKDYSSYVVCNNDTLYIARNRGPIEVPDGKGGIYGYSIQGVQVVPLNIKVGDELQPFTDISIVFPVSTDIMVKKKVFSHNSTSSSREFGFYTDSNTGESGFGNYNKTSTQAVYKMIDVAVRKTLSGSAHFVHYAHAVVSGEEELTVNGTKYKAYIIDSEHWSKMTMTEDFESADAAVANAQKQQSLKMQNKMQRFMHRKGFTNELGYSVNYAREWFVPEYGGMVKVQAFDLFGGLSSETKLVSIE